MIILPQKSEQFPLNWEQIFGRAAPLAVEIGFGNGEFLVNWASRHPDWNFVGIDLSRGSVQRLQKRLLQNAIHNVRILHEDARFALRELFPNNSIKEAIMNFPDPWPKKRHKERRMLQPSFVETLAAVLKKGGRFELVSDQQWLVEETRALFLESPFFEAGQIVKNPARLVTTKYEKKWRESGLDSFGIVSVKEKDHIISRMLEDAQMPHAIIKNEVNPEQVQSLVGQQHREGGRMFVVKSIFTDPDQNNYLLSLIAVDDDYQQKFYVLMRRRIDSRGATNWLVKLDEICPVYPTPAVKMAVQQIGKILSLG